jgi:hypothetical protein
VDSGGVIQAGGFQIYRRPSLKSIEFDISVFCGDTPNGILGMVGEKARIPA